MMIFTQNRISDFVNYLIKYDYEFMCTTYLIKNNEQLKNHEILVGG